MLVKAYGGDQASLKTSYTLVLPRLPEHVEDIAVHSGRRGVVPLELALELEPGLHGLGDVGWACERGVGGVGGAY